MLRTIIIIIIIIIIIQYLYSAMESEDTEALGVARLRQDEHVYRCRLKVSMEVHK